MNLGAILAAARARVALAPGLGTGTGGAQYPPPESLSLFPVVVVEAGTGRNDLGGNSAEGELAVRRHGFAVNVFAEKGFSSVHYAAAVTLFDQITELIDADPTLGGAVTWCGWTAYSFGKLTYAGTECTGVTITCEAEEK